MGHRSTVVPNSDSTNAHIHQVLVFFLTSIFKLFRGLAGGEATFLNRKTRSHV